MKLYFVCPENGEVFCSADYSLNDNYRIIETNGHHRELEGTVSLNSGCPLCGKVHHYQVKDVMCSLKGESE